MGDLTTNFNRKEFACKGQNCCGGSAPISLELVNRLQVVREAYGKPLTINSGFRCNRHNAAIKGAKLSQHIYGTAADIKDPDGALAAYLLEHLCLLENVGLWMEHPDCTKGWVHLDTKKRTNRVFKP